MFGELEAHRKKPTRRDRCIADAITEVYQFLLTDYQATMEFDQREGLVLDHQGT